MSHLISTSAVLPAELYSLILSFVPSEELQWTAYALTSALPCSPIPRYHLFTHVRLTRPEQALKLYEHLRNHSNAEKWIRDAEHTHVAVSDDRPPACFVRALSLETWSVDANVFVNLVQLLPNLESLSLRIGSSDISPEHLERLLSPSPSGAKLFFKSLKYLSLRFRPYSVQKATSSQLLQGAYFDSTLIALSRWPETSSIPVLSIVQDPSDVASGTQRRSQTFARPLVFFHLDVYLSMMLHSRTVASTLHAFRLRIPSRGVARSLCMTLPLRSDEDSVGVDYRTADFGSHLHGLSLGEWAPGNANRSPPLLKYLDLSTCSVLEREVDMILVKYHALEHLVLDNCSTLREEMKEGEWAAMGKRCALVGVTRAKEREKKVKAWLEAQAQNGSNAERMGVEGDFPVRDGTMMSTTGNLSLLNVAITAGTRGGRHGRHGLPVATLSLRDRELRTYGRPSVARSTGGARQGAPKIRVLPPLPSLVSLSIMTSPLVKPEKHATIRSEFETGWAEGMAQLSVTRARLRTSAENGVRVVGFSGGSDGTEAGFDGLEDVMPGNRDKEEESDGFSMPTGLGDQVGIWKAPVLCLAGGRRGPEHIPSCGHEVGWEIWKEWDGVI
ncbi:hypothetical protein AX17_000737 [Amanita inopinata Kibby_2008]|nr:hypothetical protein AX17_000737 [Amanita inopinata Kibby_2008]